MLAVLKCQQFGDSKSDKTESRRSKCQRLDEHDTEKGNGLDNKEENGLDKDESKIENSRYVLPPFIPLFLLLQKVLNRPSDLS